MVSTKQTTTAGRVGLIPQNKDARIQLLVRPDVKDALRKKAEILGTSMNDYVCRLIENDLGFQVKKG